MRFQSIQWAFLLIPLLVILIWNFFKKKKLKPTLQISTFGSGKKNVDFLKKIARSSFRVRIVFIPDLLKIIAIVFMILALMRPQTSDTKVKKNIEGIDIMIVLDVSDSMQIEDMKPSNRLEAARDTIRRFVKARTTDRIGLVIFAGEAFTLVPLTLDYELLLKRVEEITTAQEAHIKDGTAIGVALANGANRLKDSVAKSKVMIFATDGESNSGTIDPETGLDIAKGYGIKIYSVGIGRDGPTKIPVYMKDVMGNKIKTYQPFESTVNENLLERMAKETGGKYYRASREDSLQKVFQDIDQLEKIKIDINKYVRYNEHFQIFIWMAILSYSLGLLLSATWLRRNP